MKEVSIVIIGSGPAGYTAGVYTARAGFEPVIFAGEQIGGQLMWTSDIENFPGFPDGVKGPELMSAMRKQCERFGAKIMEKNVSKVNFKDPENLIIECDGEEYRARAVIIATGAEAKWLGIPSEQRLRGKGVSACATCDGFFFKGKEVIVVGGGDVAMEDAHVLSTFCPKVTILVRSDRARASTFMLKQAEENPKIEILYNTEIKEINGADSVQGVSLINNKTNETFELPDIKGVFVAIGHAPATGFLEGQIEMEKGYITIKKPFSTETSVPGVFAAGDVFDYKYRQAITAAGSGCMAAIDAQRYLDQKK